MNILEIIDKANECYKNYGRTDEFIKMEDEIVASEDPTFIYLFALKVNGADIAKFTDAIIATKNVEHISRFARSVDGADVDRLSNAIDKIWINKFKSEFGKEHLETDTSSENNNIESKLE